jgi:signal transduction histidine kinase/DNA-binding response OmpR family regulator
MIECANILLVDDQPVNLDALEAVLEAPHYRIVRAQTAEQALLAVLREEFAAIVLDIKMPGTDGLELAAMIKGRKRTQHVPILFLTAHMLDETDILKGYGTGAVDYLTKPVTPQILRSKIAVFVDLFRKTRALGRVNAVLKEEISGRERAQDELRQANDALESRVRERTADLTVLNEALRQSQQQLAAAVAAGNIATYRWDAVARTRHYEKGTAGPSGLPDVSGTGHDAGDFLRTIDPLDRDSVETALRRCFESGADIDLEYRMVLPGGSTRWLLDRGRAIRDEAGAIVRITGAIADITERKLAERALREHSERLDVAVAERTAALKRSHERLRQAERLASVGTLAAGLGHDMSNLLLPIRARIEALADSGIGDAAMEDVAAIREAASYLQRLSAGLRLLAVDPEIAADADLGPTELASWWNEVEGVYRAVLPRGVRLEGACPQGVPPAAISASRLTQAVFNLVQNAGEALASSGDRAVQGTIFMRARVVDAADALRDRKDRGAGSRPGYHAVREPRRALAVTVSDNGPGMTPEVASRCFDPYFSTKVREVSTGLGLAMVRAWIEGAGGSVSLQTAPGQGTHFTLVLPVATDALREPAPCGSIPRAAVTLDDPRTAAFICAFAPASSISISEWEGENTPNADLWIVGGAAATQERIAAFLAHGPARRAMVLVDGRGGKQAVIGGAGVSDDSRVRVLGRRPPVAELRTALLDLLRDAPAVSASAT